ncbi:ras-associated and pleckstrin homology domains-containing protein 1-like isoform X2 [Osmerus eperlanus]|uniref:ras-associated and pleckstrin homology domains-containing protein 1-like isoform X2 n=1 Tax=Osmerus eperlanus TaxID=29151 RepID=UPI002E0E5E1C
MDQVSDDELDHGAEEDSDKEDQDLDKMFGAWLGELDKLTQSLDDGRPQKAVQKAPLRQETNMANFSYRFSMYNINEALNQGDAVDLDALMADLCTIEQELSTVGKPSASRQAKGHQRGPAGRGGSAKQAGGGGGGSSGGSSSSSTRASPANTVRGAGGGGGAHGRPPASNFSLDDITAQLEKASLSMDEAARQTSSSSSSSSSSSYSSATLRRPSSEASGGQHRRAGSVGAVSEHEVASSRSSVNSASASSMDSLDIDKVLRGGGAEQDPAHAAQGQTSTEHSYLDRETSLILKSIAGKPSHLLTKVTPRSLALLPSAPPAPARCPNPTLYYTGLIVHLPTFISSLSFSLSLSLLHAFSLCLSTTLSRSMFVFHLHATPVLIVWHRFPLPLGPPCPSVPRGV